MLIKDHHCLESILDAIQRIKEYSGEFHSADVFNDDYRSFDAAMMNFVVIGEMVDKLSDDFKLFHRSIEWAKIKDFRNIVAHDYFGIDAEEVWQIIKKDIPELEIALTTILSNFI
jgi:uncharacterized protein with HEPN domain